MKIDFTEIINLLEIDYNVSPTRVIVSESQDCNVYDIVIKNYVCYKDYKQCYRISLDKIERRIRYEIYSADWEGHGTSQGDNEWIACIGLTNNVDDFSKLLTLVEDHTKIPLYSAWWDIYEYARTRYSL